MGVPQGDWRFTGVAIRRGIWVPKPKPPHSIRWWSAPSKNHNARNAFVSAICISSETRQNTAVAWIPFLFVTCNPYALDESVGATILTPSIQMDLASFALCIARIHKPRATATGPGASPVLACPVRISPPLKTRI